MLHTLTNCSSDKDANVKKSASFERESFQESSKLFELQEKKEGLLQIY